MDIKSQQLLIDFWLKEDITEVMLDSIIEVIEKELTIIKKIEHQFNPDGKTVIFILGESHFSIHTYPEQRYITMDLYVCNMSIDLESILYKIVARLPVLHKEHKFITRGRREEFQESGLGDGKNKLMGYQVMGMTFFLATCSILYELLLAQSLSSTMGNTALRYNTTIGLYIASMGIGALLFHKLFKEKLGEKLLKVELLLALIGGIAPVLVLSNDMVLNLLSNKLGFHFFGFFSQSILSVLNYGLIIIIGFLSGLELPLLIEIGKKINKKMGIRLLAIDYLGTFFGVILFPLILFPKLSLFTIGYLVAFLNASVAVYLCYSYKVSNRFLKWSALLMTGMFLTFLFFSEKLNELILDKIYFYNL